MLPTLPQPAAERAQALAAIAASIVGTYGATTALALASWIDDAVADDAEALALWTEATRGDHGGDRKSAPIIVDNVNVDPAPARPVGNSREAALRRLNKLEREGDERAADAAR